VGRYGQAILTIAGTIVGSYFGYPALGAALGSLAGSLLFPTQLPTVSGPRLQDITQTTSSVGTSIPRGWGTFSVAGAVIYQSDLREVIVTEDVGGKGGPSQEVETPTYYQDFAIALCEGEDPIANLGPIAGVRRMWANGKPVYDRRPKQDDETDSEFNQRIAASDVLDTQMVIYLGTEDQEPDPTMEADLGVGEVSAFRGLAYIVLINWQNKPEDGNKMPLNWKFEVYTDGALDTNAAFEYSNGYLPPWFKGQDIPLYSSSLFYNFSVRHTGWTYGSGRSRVSGSWSTLSQAMSAAAAVALRNAQLFNGYTIVPNSGSQAARGLTNFAPGHSNLAVEVYDANAITLYFNVIKCEKYGRGGNSWPELAALGMAPGSPVHTNGYFLNNDVHNPAPCGVYQWWPGDYSSAVVYRRSVNIDHAITTGRNTNPGAVLITGDLGVYVTRKMQPPGDQCAIDVPSLPGYCISTRGNLVRKQSWSKIDVSFANLAKVLARKTTKVTQLPGLSSNYKVTEVSQYPLNPCLPNGHADYNNQLFWEAAYAQAVAQGAMPAGLTYGVHYPKTQDWYYRRTLTQDTIETQPIPLDDVVRDLMRESGYIDDDFDVTALSTQTVLGYVRTGVMAGRAAIEPLRQAKFFDGIESAGIIKYVRRGGPIVRSLTLDDLGFTIAGDDPPSKLTTQTIDETTLPRTVRVHYLSVSRDYEPGEQLSPTRAGTKSTNDLDVTLPMVLEDDEAARIAEVLWSDAWTSRKTHQAVIDCGIQELEPTDPIEVPLENRTSRVRILSIEDSYPALRRMELIRDDDGAYVSNAVGSTPGYVRHPLQIASPAELVLLDIPALRDEDDDAGVYAAVRPYLTDSAFRGATILRSVDNGGTYSSLGPVGTPTPMGYLLSSVPDGIYTVWDESNTIRVQMQYGDLESRSEDEVLAGANAAAIGAHGRWEIVQFRDATHLGNGVYELTGLLRGRRGTEYNVGLAVADDRFVMLSMGGLVRLQMNVSDVGAERLYKVVAQGSAFADAEAQSFTSNGEALRPFSPVHIEASLEVDGDIVVEWIRRGRLGQTLQDGTDIALSEESEEYEVDVEIDGAVVRTIEVTAQTATYTAAQQAADFGTITGGEIAFAVYQISASVGRGHVGRLTTSLDLIEDTQSEVDEVDDTVPVVDANALIVPLIYDEVDEAVAPLTWTRLGDGPRITPRGFMGDAYGARLRATAGLPSYATSAAGALYLRATIGAFDCQAHSTADRVVSICVNDATANPKLEFAMVDDPTHSDRQMIACRAYTGSMQTQRMAKRDWRFSFTYPEKSVSAIDAVPMGVMYDGVATLLTAFYTTHSRCHRVETQEGALNGTFVFPGLDVISSIADRESDGTAWFANSSDEHISSYDLATSFETGAAVIESDVDLTALASFRAIEWVTYVNEGTDDEGTEEDESTSVEYLAVCEYATSGTPYIYLFDSADVVDGAVLLVADRVRRLAAPTHVTGISYKDGYLYAARATSGGIVTKIGLDEWLETGADGDSYTSYVEANAERIDAPTQQCHDVDFDPSGFLWCATSGESADNDDPNFLAVWASPLTSLNGFPTANVCSAWYDGAGTLQIRMNDKLFATKSWTPTPTPAAVSIGGPPQASAGQGNGFFSGFVRDVIVQGSDYNPLDYDDGIVYENNGTVEETAVPIENPGAEDGTTGWTDEIGGIAANGNPGHTGGDFFYGGMVAQSKARQRLDLSTIVDFDIDRLDDGDCWAIARWHGTHFASQADNEQAGIRFLDASQVQISENLSGAAGFDGWTARSYGLLIPANTRYIDILMQMTRVDGTQNDGYIDDLSIAIYVPVPSE
jgi:hypothetical protein